MIYWVIPIITMYNLYKLDIQHILIIYLEYCGIFIYRAIYLPCPMIDTVTPPNKNPSFELSNGLMAARLVVPKTFSSLANTRFGPQKRCNLNSKIKMRFRPLRSRQPDGFQDVPCKGKSKGLSCVNFLSFLQLQVKTSKISRKLLLQIISTISSKNGTEMVGLTMLTPAIGISLPATRQRNDTAGRRSHAWWNKTSSNWINWVVPCAQKNGNTLW